MATNQLVQFDEGWSYVQKGITKLKALLDGESEAQFTAEEYMRVYETIYNMCTQKMEMDYSQRLYGKYRETFEEYLSSTVLPSLQEKHDEFLLRDFAKSWSNHKFMAKWMVRFFNYLDRYYTARKALPGLNELALTCFRDLVYKDINGKVRDAILFLIDQEREGVEIDQALLKNVVDIFVEIGMGKMDAYVNDFELPMLNNTAAYYSRKASKWVLEDSLPDFKLKETECLKLEKYRASHYLHSSSETKLLERVQLELMTVRTGHLLLKEVSG